MSEGTDVGWRDVGAVVKASAEKRLGRLLLMAYTLLAVFGLAAIAVSILMMRC